LKLGHIAQQLGCELRGDGDIDIRRVAGIDEAQQGDITFVSNRKYASVAAGQWTLTWVPSAVSPRTSDSTCRPMPPVLEPSTNPTRRSSGTVCSATSPPS